MNRILAITITSAAMAFLSAVAGAQERAGDAALGAISGAIVGGPVGAVAGGVIGFTAGPNIARGLGLKRHRPQRARVAAARRNAPPKEGSNATPKEGSTEGH